MLVFDASSIIYAWDNYPEPQFPALWNWISDRFNDGEFVLPRIAFVEIGHKSPDCIQWLGNKAIGTTGIDNSIVQEAMRIKGLLGIVGEAYSAKGVDENDLFIIATAKIKGMDLVSDEGRQNDLPRYMANMKIPAVCGHSAVGIRCINFIDLIRESKVVFG